MTLFKKRKFEHDLELFGMNEIQKNHQIKLRRTQNFLHPKQIFQSTSHILKTENKNQKSNFPNEISNQYSTQKEGKIKNRNTGYCHQNSEKICKTQEDQNKKTNHNPEKILPKKERQKDQLNKLISKNPFFITDQKTTIESLDFFEFTQSNEPFPIIETINKTGRQTLNSIETITQTETKTEENIPWFIILDEDENDSFKPPKLLPFPNLDKQDKFTLCLDLDQTLVSSSFDENDNYDFAVEFNNGGVKNKVFVTKRPYLDDFLEKCSQMFEVVVFTASVKFYADSILDQLDPEKKLISYRLFRDSCSNFKDGYLKDLSILGRDIEKIIIVDDTPFSYSRNRRNAIPAKPFFVNKTSRNKSNPFGILNDWKKDRELLRILKILKIVNKEKCLFQTLDKIKKNQFGRKQFNMN
ncbi:nuclear lim interactor-interacting factor-related [Anaeramoeba flamelloides]|uniref:Nuclear lim interactor-interacting factor-related n=1 Tax=Anaeramoeba flamelloides TaxID=1746091 RepID=A0ABQ8Y182_9EUKA|nr:nuclear lim interactor-interacting factor-related [Anaeramoeba flamelloides]